jgi:methionyl aminopeptidase
MTVKTLEEIAKIREGGRKLAGVLEILKKETKSGVSTIEIDRMAEKLILELGGKPSFKGYKGSKDSKPFPATICISINDEVVHGVPTGRIIKEGDLIGLDIGMQYKGLFTDMAETIIVGGVGDELGEKLIKVTKESLDLAISIVRAGIRTGDIGEVVQNFIEAHGFGVVRQLVGHGVGYKVHEEPFIPNWGVSGQGAVLKENMVIAIEPMVTEGDYNLFVGDDGWTWKTKDGKRAAHFEHTMAVTKSGVEILTML